MKTDHPYRNSYSKRNLVQIWDELIAPSTKKPTGIRSNDGEVKKVIIGVGNGQDEYGMRIGVPAPESVNPTDSHRYISYNSVWCLATP